MLFQSIVCKRQLYYRSFFMEGAGMDRVLSKKFIFPSRSLGERVEVPCTGCDGHVNDRAIRVWRNSVGQLPYSATSFAFGTPSLRLLASIYSPHCRTASNAPIRLLISHLAPFRLHILPNQWFFRHQLPISSHILNRSAGLKNPSNSLSIGLSGIYIIFVSYSKA